MRCEIRFPRVEGYRVELPEERLTAEFNDDSMLELTPDLVGPSITQNAGIIGEGVDLNLVHTGRPAPLDAALPPHPAPALHQVARPRRRAQAAPVRPAQAHHPAVARRPAWSARAAPIPAQLMYQELADMACERITAGITRALVGRAPDQGRARPLQPHRLDDPRQLQHLEDRPLGDRRPPLPHQLGRSSTATGRPSSAAWPRPTRGCGPTSRTTTSASRCPTATAPRRAKYLPDFIVLVDDGHGDDDLLH